MSISSFNRLGELTPTYTFLGIGLGDKMMNGLVGEVEKISVAEKTRVKARFEEFGSLVEDVIHAVPKNSNIMGGWGVDGYNKIKELTKCEKALAVMYLFENKFGGDVDSPFRKAVQANEISSIDGGYEIFGKMVAGTTPERIKVIKSVVNGIAYGARSRQENMESSNARLGLLLHENIDLGKRARTLTSTITTWVE